MVFAGGNHSLIPGLAGKEAWILHELRALPPQSRDFHGSPRVEIPNPYKQRVLWDLDQQVRIENLREQKTGWIT